MYMSIKHKCSVNGGGVFIFIFLFCAEKGKKKHI